MQTGSGWKAEQLILPLPLPVPLPGSLQRPGSGTGSGSGTITYFAKRTTQQRGTLCDILGLVHQTHPTTEIRRMEIRPQDRYLPPVDEAGAERFKTQLTNSEPLPAEHEED